MAAEEIIPLSKAYQPYVLELSTADEDATVYALAICVFLRGSGMLLAVPDGFLDKEVLDMGLMAGPDDHIGPSKVVKLPLGVLADPKAGASPKASGKATSSVLLVDVTVDMADSMRVFEPDFEQMEILHMFKNGKPDLFPLKESLLVKATEWVTDPGSGERVNFYSAAEEEVEEDRPDPSEPGQGTGTEGEKKKQKKPTVASLSKVVEELAQAIPIISSQLAALEKRTSEPTQVNPQPLGATPKSTPAQAVSVPTRAALLAQPLSGSVMTGQQIVTPVSSLLKDMPPPRVPAKPRVSAAAGAPPEVEEMMETRDMEASSSTDLARAVLAQSNALTALVGQIAQGGDHMTDLSSTSLGFSTKGAAGRARLQQELALQRGTFFVSVLQSMSRRMQPSIPADQTPSELMQRGVCSTRYMERYGGFGRCRDIGSIMWQVCLVMDHLQNDNMPAAKDSLSLLLVCLEQTALDGGKMDIGLLLSLAEDPPASLYTNRSLSSTSRSRAFAPTADQRWITTALSYIRELDLISSKRQEVTGRADSDPPANPKAPGPKKAAKWIKKQKRDRNAEEVDQ